MSELCRSDAAYVMGALSPADRREYEAHLRDCRDCQAAVQRIAGLPGLLALTTEGALKQAPAVPDTLLPALVERVEATRRRRRWISAGLVAAAVAAIVAVSTVLVVNRTGEADEYSAGGPAAGAPSGGSASTTAAGPGSPASAAPVPDEQTPMTQVVPGPMTASLELFDRKWGTAITVICTYSGNTNSSVSYDLAVLDVDGHRGSAGTWRAVPGATARVNAATAVPRNRIVALEVRLPDGRTILRSVP